MGSMGQMSYRFFLTYTLIIKVFSGLKIFKYLTAYVALGLSFAHVLPVCVFFLGGGWENVSRVRG